MAVPSGGMRATAARGNLDPTRIAPVDLEVFIEARRVGARTRVTDAKERCAPRTWRHRPPVSVSLTRFGIVS